jgi:hypothetical protein
MEITKVRELSMVTRYEGASSRVTLSGTVSVTYVTTSFQMFPEQPLIDSKNDSLVRNYVTDLWAADWDNDDDAIYDG